MYYGIYHHYASDYKGDYDLSVAVDKLSGADEVLVVPEQHYVYFEVDTSRPQGVYEMWQHIWQQPLKRTYLFDYEAYFVGGRIQIAIGIEK